MTTAIISHFCETLIRRGSGSWPLRMSAFALSLRRSFRKHHATLCLASSAAKRNTNGLESAETGLARSCRFENARLLFPVATCCEQSGPFAIGWKYCPVLVVEVGLPMPQDLRQTKKKCKRLVSRWFFFWFLVSSQAINAVQWHRNSDILCLGDKRPYVADKKKQRGLILIKTNFWRWEWSCDEV